VDDRIKGCAPARLLPAEPYSFAELLARVECASAAMAVRPEETTYRVGDLELEPSFRIG